MYSCQTDYWNPKFAKRGNGIETLWMGEKYNFPTCFTMSLLNLAEPYWESVKCDSLSWVHLICVKDKKTDVNISEIYVKNNYFCGSNAFLVDGNCYEFLLTFGINYTRCPSEDLRKDIMIFKHIFEAIALEHRSTSVFVQKDIEAVISYKVFEYCQFCKTY